MINSVNEDIPLYIGKLSKQILLLFNTRQRNYSENHLQKINSFEAGKSILHTGDFRAHGFRGKSLPQVLDRYVGQIDVLVCASTNSFSGRKGKQTIFEALPFSKNAGIWQKSGRKDRKIWGLRLSVWEIPLIMR